MKATLEEHKKRLPRALAKVWDIHGTMIKYGKNLTKIPDSERPSIQPESIFDITDYGVRLIISRENHNGKTVFLHVSTSVLDTGILKMFITRRSGGPPTPEDVSDSLEWIVQKLFGYQTLLIEAVPMFIPPAGMPHWIYTDVGDAVQV